MSKRMGGSTAFWTMLKKTALFLHGGFPNRISKLFNTGGSVGQPSTTDCGHNPCSFYHGLSLIIFFENTHQVAFSICLSWPHPRWQRGPWRCPRLMRATLWLLQRRREWWAVKRTLCSPLALMLFIQPEARRTCAMHIFINLDAFSNRIFSRSME